jgi:DNA-binding response OmpR family regulator
VVAHNSTPTRLAVIDVDSGFVQVLSKRLEGVGWQYRVLGSVPRVEDLVAMRLNALVVDLGMLGPDAWSFLDRVCAELPGMGVIVCTGRSTVAQRVRGLRFGADDWLTKPCHPEELIARVEAVVRRRKRASVGVEKGAVLAGELEIRADQFQAFVAGSSLDLTRREFEVLELLADAKGQVLEREEIYQRVWGYAMARGDRSVDVFVRKVRQKLEKASPKWEYIHTHFGIGYRFQPVGEEAEAPPPPEPPAASETAKPVAPPSERPARV